MKPFPLNLTPDSHLIESAQNTKISAPEAISELVDNSLDAGATRIDVFVADDAITVKDNGRGCADVECMLTFGRHRKQSSTKLGRYGVGLKNASTGMGDLLSIETIHKNVKRTAELSWQEVKERGWHSVKGIEHEEQEQLSGTTIEFGALYRKPLIRPVHKDLEFSFAPAMSDGKLITVNGERLDPWTPPILSGEIVAEEEHDSLPISFSLRAGLTEFNDRAPFILAYEHRIIGGTTEPCGEFNTSSKFIALVKLSGDWSLLKHKDGLKDGLESAWLWERLRALCDALLRQVHKLSENVDLDAISAQLEDAFYDILTGQAKRPNRNGEKKETNPINGTRKIGRATAVGGNGDVLENKPATRRRGFGIVYDQLQNGILGKVDVNGKRVCVQLNELHPFIQDCREAKNLVSLKTCAAFLLCAHQATTDDKSQMVLRFEQQTQAGKFSELASLVFASMTKTNKSQRQKSYEHTTN